MIKMIKKIKKIKMKNFYIMRILEKPLVKNKNLIYMFMIQNHKKLIKLKFKKDVFL